MNRPFKQMPIPFLFLSLFFLVPVHADTLPKILDYAATPTAYFNDHAKDVARHYDGLFFTIGSWDEGVSQHLGFPPEQPPKGQWLKLARENLLHLRQAGVTENLLGISFSASAPWPSPDTLLSEKYTEKMIRHFHRLGEAARELGFRGVNIDLEYPYKRYELDNEIYKYDTYTPQDLLRAAHQQGQEVMKALLNAYPDMVVFVLPTGPAGRPIVQAFQLGMLEIMAERDAPGGMHIGLEQSYCLLDPASQTVIPCIPTLSLHKITHDKKILSYWHRRCDTAPGVWPLHMVETGGKNYPKRPWKEELAELRQQMRILRSVSKSYIWCYSGNRLWYPPSKEIQQQYGLRCPSFEGATEAFQGWFDILQDRQPVKSSRLKRLIKISKAYQHNHLSDVELCDRFGTPAQWLVLGPLTNPFINRAFAAPEAVHAPATPDYFTYGRDGIVHWIPFRSNNPLGIVGLRPFLDWWKTDNLSVHLVTSLECSREISAWLWLNWDDGMAIWIDGKPVFEHLDYPKRGHGLLYRDRYLFEDKVPVHLSPGKHRLSVTSVNLWGGWGIHLRLADADGYPVKGVRFRLPSEWDED